MKVLIFTDSRGQHKGTFLNKKYLQKNYMNILQKKIFLVI